MIDIQMLDHGCPEQFRPRNHEVIASEIISVPNHSARLLDSDHKMVYAWCMSRTNIDIDEKACAAVMRRYQFSTKREAVNFALQALATEPFSLDDARKLRGSGWDGDLEEMRANRST